MCVKSGREECLLQYVLRDRDATDVFIEFDIGKIASSAFTCSNLCIPTFSEAETRLVFRNFNKIRNARSRNMQNIFLKFVTPLAKCEHLSADTILQLFEISTLNNSLVPFFDKKRQQKAVVQLKKMIY